MKYNENKKIESYYDDLADEYDRLYRDNLSLAENEVVKEMLESYILPNENIIDLCCGTGLYLDLTKHNPTTYMGIDMSKKMVAAAQKKHPEATFITQEIEKLAHQKEADAITGLFCTNLMLNEDELFAIINRLLRKGGKLFLMLPSKFSIYNIRKLVEEDEKNFQKVDNYNIRNCDKDLPTINTNYYSSKELIDCLRESYRDISIQGFNFFAELRKKGLASKDISEIKNMLQQEMSEYNDLPDLGFYLIVQATKN